MDQQQTDYERRVAERDAARRAAYERERRLKEGDAQIGVCQLKPGRFFWIAGSFHEVFEDYRRPDAGAPDTGEAATADLAVAAGRLALAARGLTPGTEPWPVGFVRSWRRRQRIKHQMAAPPPAQTSSGAAELELLYGEGHWYIPEWGPVGEPSTWSWGMPHRVVKKTATRVYVDREYYSETRQRSGTWSDWDVRTYALDRATLERDGRVRSWPARTTFCTAATMERDEREAHDRQQHYRVARETAQTPEHARALAVLGLGARATRREVQRAYRRLARQHHPDVGGDAERFIEIQGAYERAVQFVGP